MNIGIVTTWFERGAAYVSRQYRDLLAADHKVSIYARGGECSGRGNPRWDDGSVTWASGRGPRVATYVDRKDFMGWVERSALDVVFFNEQHFWLPIVWCHQAGIKTGAYIDYYTETTIQLYAAYDFLLCNTKRHFSAFNWHDQAFYIPWGTTLGVFKPTTLDPVTDENVVFFHSAGMSPTRKGTGEAIEAFARVTGPARLIIHTQVPLREEFPALVDQIDSLEREGRLQIIEATISAPGLYHLGDVYVYPSRLEGIGLTIAEALACGLPVIVANQPPMNEFVDPEGKNGALVPVTMQYARADGYFWPQCRIDSESLTRAMQEYVDSRSTLAARKKNAYQYAVKHLDWSSRHDVVCYAFEKSKIIASDRKHAGIDASLRHEYSRLGGRLDLWLKFPWLCECGQNIGRALRAIGRPLIKVARKILQ
jgi:1,2-diacylglycerol 3-alpha-glucosyltransferase